MNWLNRKLYPFKSHYLQIENQQLHYIDEGEGPILLFVHGTPSWSFDFRHLIKALSKSYRCIALDHIGFGLSDKPKDYPYSIDQHAKNLEKLIEHLKLEQFSLLLHDFGGPIGWEYALKYPEKIEKLVVMNSWLGSSKEDPNFKKMEKILKSPILPFLYKQLNFSARFLLPQAFANKKLLTKDIRKHYRKPFGKASERIGPLAFAKSLLNDQDLFEQQNQQAQKLSKSPSLLIWGMADSFIGAHYLQQLQAALPHSKSVELEGVGHFPQEEAPEKVLDALNDFL